MSADPLRTLWNALESADCAPRGKPYDFRARCPAHGGENPHSLHVGIGADGRAVLWCFARQCSAEEICAALGLSVADLFPPSHPLARRLPLRPVKRPDFAGVAAAVANSLFALEQFERPWQLMLTSACPQCGSPGAWLRAHSRGHGLANGLVSSEGRAEADCPAGCDSDGYVQGLLGLLDDRKEQSHGE